MKKTAFVLSFILTLFCLNVFCGCTQQSNTSTYQIVCELDGNELKGEQKLNYYNDTDTTITVLKFNLHANAFREGAKFNPISPQHVSKAYYNGISYGSMNINEVKIDGEHADFEICGEDQNVLAVTLKEELYPSERVEIKIDYTLKIANVVARTGFTKKTVNLANFYPILCGYDSGFYECVYYSTGDPYFSDCADYEVSITCDANYNVASSGKLIQRKDDSSKATATYKLCNARSFALVLSTEFESITDVSNGTEIIYYFYDDKSPDKALECAVKALRLFSERFGAYPYETFSVVQTGFIQGGMEFPALVMISYDLEESAYLEVIAHETAHQWWQSVVGNNEIEHGFLDEGLAEYSVVIFYENYPEYNMDRKMLIESAEKTYKTFCSVSDKIFGSTNTVMERGLKDFSSEYEYVNIAYIKPCIMYDYLRQTIGEKAFFNGLKKYYEEYSFKNAKPDDLIGVFERCGTDANGFFRSFFDGKVVI